MGKIAMPVVSATLAAGSVSSPYVYNINITQRLCFPTCTANTPVFNPSVMLTGFNQVSEGLYMASIRIDGICSYIPCNGGCCNMIAQPISAVINIPVVSATAPTASSVTIGTVNNIVAASGCAPCSRTFVSEFPLSLTVTA